MFDGREPGARRATVVLACLALTAASAGCGQASNDPYGISRSGSGGTGRAGSTSTGGTSTGGTGASAAGTGGSAVVDGGAAGSMMGSGGGGQQLPADCPEINPIPVPGQTIVLRSVTFEPAMIVLQNVSDTIQVIGGGRQGWQWCNFPAYWPISEAGDVELSPGETFAFEPFYNENVRQLDPEGGEMGIYTTTGAYTTASLMRAFTSWGDVLSQREPTAVAGGYWIFNERIEIGPGDAGFVIVGESDRASGYQAVRAACLVPPPNEED